MQPVEQTPPQPDTHTTETLLVVDDEPTIRDLLAASLRFAGFDVVSAATGAEAVASARRRPPHLVLLDVMLPDMDGFEVARLLRDSVPPRAGSRSGVRADPLPHRARRDTGPHPGPERGRRRLRHQTLRPG